MRRWMAILALLPLCGWVNGAVSEEWLTRGERGGGEHRSFEGRTGTEHRFVEGEGHREGEKRLGEENRWDRRSPEFGEVNVDEGTTPVVVPDDDDDDDMDDMNDSDENQMNQ